MELDKRIISGKKPLTCFDAEQARNFVGKKCYLTNDISLFSDLNAFKDIKGCNEAIYEGVADTLTNINTEVSLVFETTYLRWKFCIPCEWVKEEEASKHIDFEAAKKDSNFELCEMYGNELLFDTKNNIFYTSDGNVHTYLTVLAQRHYNEEQPKDVIIEKKYRPYTIKDFEKAFLDGEFEDFIIFRDKHNPDDIYTMRYNGNFVRGKVEFICLGTKNFSFEYLFENYKVADYDGDWQPFGILEE